ncbi:MAG: bifunctional metallophosphatase/5'-nucleotidase [Lachnospiraceae bacterium]|nr:bifunctional metallophosphatase/5'-nucleotidase [Lachnospiraceae bacterium]
MTGRKLTILHANDLHGQLQFQTDENFTLCGGISLTAGYIGKVRREEPRVFFGICGDILQEDILGSDYKGTNTVSLINHIRPDALSLGNHELDYGLAHLLTFQRCINAPTLCANMVVANLGQPLFRPSMVYETGGVRILLIGIIPEAFLKKILSDEFCRSMLEYKDSYAAIREEIEAHKKERIDLVVLMSHYGIEGDRILAEQMPEDLHVDLILGGHSHINMDAAEEIGGILLAQSSYGTTHIGRFDLELDPEHGGISSWKWERVALTEENAPFDTGVDELADRIVFQKKKRGNEKLCEFAGVFTNGSRLYETQLGDIVADAFLEMYGPELVILQSGSLRLKEAGPEIDEKVLAQLYPFDDRFVMAELTGRELLDGFAYLFSLKPDGSVMNGTFQYSRGFRLTVDGEDCWNRGCRVLEMTLDGQELDPERTYSVGITKNCSESFLRYFGFAIPPERIRLVSLSTYCDLAKWCLMRRSPVEAPEQGRFRILNFEQ